MHIKILLVVITMFFYVASSFAQTENQPVEASLKTSSSSVNEEEPRQTEEEVQQNRNQAEPQARARGGSSVVTLSATVKGNQEQPKVLYIVPWQAAQDDRILYQPLNSQTNRIFGHIERSEHNRELEFISELEGENGEKN